MKQARLMLYGEDNPEIIESIMKKFDEDDSYIYNKVLWEYPKMMKHFWIWNFSKMTNDRKKYLEVINYKND
ncbi:MAG: hypothetical protein PHP92_03950 [Candidatus Nanoarchaeia archaeon]|nr:hypothetical protein [Candidatus Nanoarchaeia archaeon]